MEGTAAPGFSAVISILRHRRDSTSVVIVKVVDPDLPTTNEPPPGSQERVELGTAEPDPPTLIKVVAGSGMS